MKKMNKRKVLHATAVGLSLAITPLLTRHSVIDTYAQVALTPDEENAINNFLATEPVNGDTTNIGPVAVTQPSINYTFPGRDNYTSVFLSRAQRAQLGQNITYMVNTNGAFDGTSSGPHQGKVVKIKDPANVEAYLAESANNPPGPSYIGPNFENVIYAKEVTLIDQADNSEFTVKNVTIRKNITSSTYPIISYDRFQYDFPIEGSDPRFHVISQGWESHCDNTYRNYWSINSEISEILPYDTIVEVDENLKTGDIVEVVAGDLGERKVVFSVDANSIQTYNLYTADDIYADLETRFNTNDGIEEFEARTHAWGVSGINANDITDPTNRVLRVGIDYTHYVTENNTPLLPTVYGLHGVETIGGYEYVSTREEANGDRVHVYKQIPAPVTTTVTPKTSDNTNLLANAGMLITGLITSAGVFLKRKKNS